MRIPSKWSDVTIGQFMELNEVTRSGADQFEATNQQIAILCGITQQDVLRMTVELRNKIVDRLSFIDTDPTGEFKSTFWLKGKRYKVTDNIKQLRAEQYIDISMFVKHGASSNYHNILAKICRPMFLGMFPRKANFEKVSNDMLSLPVPTALAIAAFFLDSLTVFTKNLPTFLEQMETGLMKEASGEDSVGISL